MRLLTRSLASFAANALGIWAAGRFISGFDLRISRIADLLMIALVFTALNTAIKPLIKLFLGPVIIITLGGGLILVNMFMLYLLDIFSENLTMNGLLPLFWGSLFLSAVNIVFHFLTK